MTERKTGGELAHKALSDNTNYNVMEVAHAICENIGEEVWKCINIHKPILDEDEFTIVRQIADDKIIKPLRDFKYYAYLYLPSPRPNQAVWLYNKRLDKITQTLWVLPNAMCMARLAADVSVVPKNYERMQAWSIAFYKGTFWEYIRHEHGITMPSEHEYFLQNREKLIKAGCKIPEPGFTDPFDFSKISIKKVVDPVDTTLSQNIH